MPLALRPYEPPLVQQLLDFREDREHGVRVEPFQVCDKLQLLLEGPPERLAGLVEIRFHPFRAQVAAQ